MAVDSWASHGTDEEKAYRFRPIKGKSLRFTVKAPHDCHLAFSTQPEDNEDIFEVFIGAWEGQASAIRFRKGDDLAKVDTPDILSEDEWKEFWVTFDDDHVKVGYGGQHESFMDAALPEHLEINYFGYTTGFGSVGWWKFHHERIVKTEDCSSYNYEPIYGTSLEFAVTASNDAHIALSSGAEDTPRMYEIFLGGWENQKCGIRLDKDPEQTVVQVETPDFLSSDRYMYFYVTFKDGHIRVGQKGNLEPFLEYVDTDPRTVTHFGYRSCWGSGGKWKLE